MADATIRVTPLTPHIGAEISDIDLTRPLAPAFRGRNGTGSPGFPPIGSP